MDSLFLNIQVCLQKIRKNSISITPNLRTDESVKEVLVEKVVKQKGRKPINLEKTDQELIDLIMMELIPKFEKIENE